jgi:tRNA dimethylallyltransferase
LTSKKVIVIAGPTASGKTAIAIKLAKRFGASIISCDSRQCYRELNIAVAKPSADQLREVPHYFINSHSIHDTVNASVFEDFALHQAEKLFVNDDIVVMVGGTGLYIRAFEKGLDPIPSIPADLRERLTEDYKQHGIDWLRDNVQKLDPEYFSSGEVHNPHRLLRAMEVVMFTGRSIRSFQSGSGKKRDFDIIKIAISIDKPELHRRISARVDEMVSSGLIEESRQLIQFRHLKALDTVGYKEIFDMLDGNITKDAAIEQIKSNTRAYAKRQMTWFRKEKDFVWLTSEAALEAEYLR